MARLKGKSIIFKVGGTDYAGLVSSVTFSSAVGTLGFGDYTDSLDYTCQVTGFQDYAASSLWMTLFDTPGASLSLIYAPHGNATASTSQHTLQQLDIAKHFHCLVAQQENFTPTT